MKTCVKCKIEKSKAEFYSNKAQPCGLDSYCKICKREIQKIIRDKYRLRINKQKRDKVKNDPEYAKRVSEQSKKSYWKNVHTRLVYTCKTRCKQRNIHFDLKVEDITIPEYCPILGAKLDKGRYAPSLDRIKPELGYIKGNVRVISKKANTMKNDANFKELLNFANNIKSYINSFDDIVQTVKNENLQS